MTFPVHPALADSTRLPLRVRAGDRLRAADILILMGAGLTAAVLATVLDHGLRIPGHSILRVVLPMSLGLAAAPRRMAGAVMGASALGAGAGLHFGGFATLGVGALTSLGLTGPLLDVALWRVKRGWPVYCGFAAAGLTANLAALVVRAGTKFIGWEPLGRRPLAEWLPHAMVTYTICGVLAGLVCALICFRLRTGGRPETD